MRPDSSRPRSLCTIAALLCAGAVLLVAHPALASVRANYVEVATWETGYQAAYIVTNDGPGDITAWTVAFDLPTSNAVSSSWDSALTRTAQHLVFRNAPWNGALTPGTSTSFGFVVVGTTRPTNCTVNGGPCDTLAPLAGALRRDAREHRIAFATPPRIRDVATSAPPAAALATRRSQRAARRARRRATRRG